MPIPPPLLPIATASTDLATRQQQAFEVARQCDRLLRERFGASKVILFGSLAGHSIWHDQSDIDLAVEGLSWDAWSLAQDYLNGCVPPGLKVDVVRLESVPPAVRARIFNQPPMPTNPYLRLQTQLEDELTLLADTAAGVAAAIARAHTPPDDYDIRAIASYLTDFYKRCERMSERVIVGLDGQLPRGENWHQAVLEQVAIATPTRPPLWTADLLPALDEYRRFRHLVVHRYGDELNPERVMALVQLQPDLYQGIRGAIAQFNQYLAQQAQAEST